MFSSRGYAGATTRDIARRAGVAEHLIFRNFGSKANLFCVAVFQPIEEMLAAHIGWLETQQSARLPTQELVRRYVEDLYMAFRENRELLLSFLAAVAFHGEEFRSSGALPSFEDALRRLEEIGQERTGERALGVDDSLIETRAPFAMALAMALFEDWILPPGRKRPRIERILRGLTKMTLFGLHPRR